MKIIRGRASVLDSAFVEKYTEPSLIMNGQTGPTFRSQVARYDDLLRSSFYRLFGRIPVF
jgi:hypothetical protein